VVVTGVLGMAGPGRRYDLGCAVMAVMGRLATSMLVMIMMAVMGVR